MWTRFILIGILLATLTSSYGQKIVTKVDKDSHLKMLKDGVLLIRLSDQDSKIKALQERGRTKDAKALEDETSSLNELIVETFSAHFTYSKINFITPVDTKQIVQDKSKPLKDVISGELIDLSSSVYFTDFGFGNPADSFERYNRKGFQLLALEDGKVAHLGRDMFYAGVKQGFFVGPFEKNMVKTVQKLNRRFLSGSRYIQ